MRVGLSALRVKLGYLSGTLRVDDNASCRGVVGVCSLDINGVDGVLVNALTVTVSVARIHTVIDSCGLLQTNIMVVLRFAFFLIRLIWLLALAVMVVSYGDSSMLSTL
jgi:hypothetical protein